MGFLHRYTTIGRKCQPIFLGAICLWALMCLGPIPGQGQYTINGSATTLGADCFQLTDETDFLGGSVWSLNRVDISEPFDLQFQVFLGCKDGSGADGMAFVLQQVSNNVGGAGGGIGYAGIQPSIAVELDTWSNPSPTNDPAYDHMALMRNGNINHSGSNQLAGPVQISSTSANVEDCAYHDFRVTWNPDSNILRVYFDCDLRLTYTSNIIQSTFGNNPLVFWGFTGATGGFNNIHRFCNDFVSFYDLMEDTAICPGTSVQLDAGAGDTYTWTPTTGLSNATSRTPIASPTTTTTYIVHVVEGCYEREDTVTVEIRPPFVPNLVSEINLCRGDTRTLYADTTWSDAIYAWSTGDLGPSTTISQPGTYYLVTATPCDTVLDSIVVRPQAAPSLAVTDASCAGTSTGRAVVSIASISPFTYTWYDGSGTQLSFVQKNQPRDRLDNLPAGNYRVQVQDGYGCDSTINFVVGEPAPLDVTLVDKEDVLCGGSATGSLTLTANGGTMPYRFAVNGGTFQASPQFTGLTAGTYLTQVRDANGCEDTLTVVITENPPLSVQVLSTQAVACFGGSTGEVLLSGTGGVGTYRYSLDGNTFQPAAQFNGLTAGTYTAYVQDTLGCEATVSFTILEPTRLQLNYTILRQVDCAGNGTGAFVVQATGGSPAYSFALGSGSFGVDTVFDNLGAGTYQVQVQDDSGCVSIDSVQITEPAPLDLQTSTLTDVLCFGDSTARLRLDAVGGTAPYLYAPLGDSLTSQAFYSGYPIGDYSFVVQDDSSCLDTLRITFTQPPLLQAQVVDRQDVDCFGNNTGVLEVSATGGVQPYLYAIDAFPFQANPVFDSLYAGFYTLRVQDRNQCEASVDTIITTPTGLAIGIDQQINVACHGDSTASLTFQAVGGTGPYQYTYDNLTFFPLTQPLTGLSASSDTLFGYDANGCLVPIPYYITEPDSLFIEGLVAQTLRCFGDSSGEIQVAGFGGAMPYTYNLNGGAFQPDSIFAGLDAGTYQITLQDDSGCVSILDTNLSEPELLIGSFDTVRMVDCWLNQLAFFQVGVSGGTLPYQLALDTAAYGTDFLFDSLGAGTYQVLILDDSLCADTLDLTITQPDSLILGIAQNDSVLCFGDSTGQISLGTTGGTLPYQFSLDSLTFQSSPQFSGLWAGTYTFTVVDSEGCMASVVDTVFEPSVLVLSLGVNDPVDCYGADNGIIQVQGIGGVPNYTYYLNGISQQDQVRYDSLAPGYYTVRLQDGNLCEQQIDSILMTEPDSLVVNLSKQDVSCYSGSDGQVVANISGGNVPEYQIRWNDPAFPDTAVLNGLRAGAYTVLVTDSLGCQDTSSITIAEPDTLVLSLVNLVNAFCSWANGAAEVRAVGGTIPYVFSWTNLPDQLSPQANDIFGGDYLVRVVDALGCEDTLSLVVGDTPPPVALFETNPEAQPFLESQNPILFENLTQGAVAYSWDFGEGSFSEDINPQHSFPGPGIYEVVLTAYNEFRVCPEDYVMTIEIIPDGHLYFPNAFSPNGDGTNDIFYLKGEGIVSIETIILDRWGRRVTTLTALDQGWDGRMADGSPAPEGAYVFKTIAVFNSGIQQNRAGTITLFR